MIEPARRHVITLLLVTLFTLPSLALASEKEERLLKQKPFNGLSKGLITHYRAQTTGHEYGPPEDRLDAEVIVQLDTTPGHAYGLRYHEGAAPATREMITLLREAYFRRLPIEIFHTKLPGRKNHTIIWVEVEK